MINTTRAKWIGLAGLAAGLFAMTGQAAAADGRSGNALWSDTSSASRSSVCPVP